LIDYSGQAPGRMKEMKPAKVVTKQGRMTPNGREMVMEVRAGEKGAGKVLGSVVYWPWSTPSCDQADRIVQEIAERNNLQLSNEEL
jgi:hypothetical protein